MPPDRGDEVLFRVEEIAFELLDVEGRRRLITSSVISWVSRTLCVPGPARRAVTIREDARVLAVKIDSTMAERATRGCRRLRV